MVAPAMISEEGNDTHSRGCTAVAEKNNEEEEEEGGGGGASNETGEIQEEEEEEHQEKKQEREGVEDHVKERKKEEEEEEEEEMVRVGNDDDDEQGRNGATPVHVPHMKSSTPPMMDVKEAGRGVENTAACVRNKHGKAKHLKANDHVATRSRWKLVALDNGVRIFQVRSESGRIHNHIYTYTHMMRIVHVCACVFRTLIHWKTRLWSSA